MKVGEKVKVCKLLYRSTEEATVALEPKLGQVGTIEELRITDGKRIGLKLSFDGESSIWFFDEEVESV